MLLSLARNTDDGKSAWITVSTMVADELTVERVLMADAYSR
jgi:hypothetical protein